MEWHISQGVFWQAANATADTLNPKYLGNHGD